MKPLFYLLWPVNSWNVELLKSHGMRTYFITTLGTLWPSSCFNFSVEVKPWNHTSWFGSFRVIKKNHIFFIHNWTKENVYSSWNCEMFIKPQFKQISQASMMISIRSHMDTCHCLKFEMKRLYIWQSSHKWKTNHIV